VSDGKLDEHVADLEIELSAGVGAVVLHCADADKEWVGNLLLVLLSAIRRRMAAWT